MAKFSCTVEFDGDEDSVVAKLNAVDEVTLVYGVEVNEEDETTNDDDDDV